MLRDDGVLWLNLGDSYTKAKGNVYSECRKDGAESMRLKPKNLVGIPWRVAFALQADGWWLRSDIIWAKGVSFCELYSGSSMPESVRDRPSKSHEYLFLLTKNRRYFYDKDAVKEPLAERTLKENPYRNRKSGSAFVDGTPGRRKQFGGQNASPDVTGRNLRSVWTINPMPYKGAHFAVFPPLLVEPCIKAATSEYGCCATCGSPWKRVLEKREVAVSDIRTGKASVTVGWEPTCRCDNRDVLPAVVLDPFAGSGTTALMADELGRHAITVDAIPSYVSLQLVRLLTERKCR